MTKREILLLVQKCQRDEEGLGTRTLYTWSYIEGTRYMAWCMHSDLYTAHQARLDKLIGNSEKIWAENRRSKFLIFECTNRVQSSAVLQRFQPSCEPRPVRTGTPSMHRQMWSPWPESLHPEGCVASRYGFWLQWTVDQPWLRATVRAIRPFRAVFGASGAVLRVEAASTGC